ncbi:hypothetical protein JHK87_024819 [Glycine soja]|nr:hypothetical protein JHK87_024819 [Glycine soja]
MALPQLQHAQNLLCSAPSSWLPKTRIDNLQRFSSGTTSMFDHGSQVSVDDRERNKDSSIGKMGKEARDVLVTCVGIGSNAIGLFHEFIAHSDVRLIRVETGGLGLESGRHSSKLTMGEVGIYHGSMSYLLQDDDGQVIEPHSIIVG